MAVALYLTDVMLESNPRAKTSGAEIDDGDGPGSRRSADDVCSLTALMCSNSSSEMRCGVQQSALEMAAAAMAASGPSRL